MLEYIPRAVASREPWIGLEADFQGNNRYAFVARIALESPRTTGNNCLLFEGNLRKVVGARRFEPPPPRSEPLLSVDLFTPGVG